jgi:protein-tyrosine-phosphatase
MIETVEIMKFLAMLASTEGISQEVKTKCNEQISKLLDNLNIKLTEMSAKQIGLIVK